MSDSLPEARCKMCRWWEAAYFNEPNGVCHHARVLERARVAYDWCNEFEHKELGTQYKMSNLESEEVGDGYMTWVRPRKQWRFPNE